MILRMELSGSSVNSGPVGAGVGRRGRRGAGAREGVGTRVAPPAAARGAGANAARRSTSWRITLPLGPLPVISAISRPISFAIRLARGEANRRPPTAGWGLEAGGWGLGAWVLTPAFA